MNFRIYDTYVKRGISTKAGLEASIKYHLGCDNPGDKCDDDLKIKYKFFKKRNEKDTSKSDYRYTGNLQISLRMLKALTNAKLTFFERYSFLDDKTPIKTEMDGIKLDGDNLVDNDGPVYLHRALIDDGVKGKGGKRKTIHKKTHRRKTIYKKTHRRKNLLRS